MINNKKVVYIAHPYGNNKRNLVRVQQIIKDLAFENSVIPFCPWYALVESLNDGDALERALGLQATLNLLDKTIVDELLICGEVISKGVAMEINKATTEGIVIRFDYPRRTNEEINSILNQLGFEPKIVEQA